MATTPIRRYTGRQLIPAIDPKRAVTRAVKIAASQNIAFGTVLAELVGQNPKYKIVPSLGANSWTGGTYKITWNSLQTAAIAVTAPKEDIKAAMELVLGVGTVKVTGGPLSVGTIYVEGIGALGAAALAAPTVDVTSVTSGGTAATTISQIQAGAAGTPGVYKAYSAAGTDGSQIPTCIAQYDIQTDASGNVTLSDTSGQVGDEHGMQQTSAPVYFSGIFNTADLTGLDTNAVALLGYLMSGTLTTGLFKLP